MIPERHTPVRQQLCHKFNLAIMRSKWRTSSQNDGITAVAESQPTRTTYQPSTPNENGVVLRLRTFRFTFVYE